MLIGDSAHLMLPTHAAGASMAIESASVLEVLMQPASTPSSIFPSTPSSQLLDGATCSDGIAQEVRPSGSASSSTQDLIVGATSSQMAESKLGYGRKGVNDLVQSSDGPESSLIGALVARSLTLFDSLRVPRCTAFQLLSNGEFLSQANPVIAEKIRRNGFDGWLPGPTAGPWSEEFIKWYFEHNAVGKARQAIAELSR